MKKKHYFIVVLILIGLCISIAVNVVHFQKNKSPNPKQAYSATASVIPNPSPWFADITDTLRNFLEQLYLTVHFFHLPTNMAYILEGLGDGTVTIPTATPTIRISPSPLS